MHNELTGPKSRVALLNKSNLQFIFQRACFYYGEMKASSMYTLGCNNGGGGGNFSKVKRSVAKWIETRKRLISVFLAPLVGFQKRWTFFSKANCTHKPIYAYLPLIMGPWNMQEYWDSDLFWLGDSRIYKGVSPLCVLAPRISNRHFFNCTYEMHFLRRIF